MADEIVAPIGTRRGRAPKRRFPPCDVARGAAWTADNGCGWCSGHRVCESESGKKAGRTAPGRLQTQSHWLMSPIWYGDDLCCCSSAPNVTVNPVAAGVSAETVLAAQLAPGGGAIPEQLGRIPEVEMTGTHAVALSPTALPPPATAVTMMPQTASHLPAN